MSVREGTNIAAVVGIFSLLQNMKVHTGAKKRCNKCKVVRRQGVVYIVCENPRHKQRQGQKQRKKSA